MKSILIRTILSALLCIVSIFSQAQIGIYQKVISDSIFSKDYRFRALPNYSLYNGITNIISPTTGTYDLTTPPGTTAQRPTVPSGKYILRYNTDSAALEIGNPSQVWKTIAQSSVQTFDTSSISNFGLKVRSLFSGTSPILYNGVTGNISIQQSNSSQAGYLSQADWVTFNAKLPDPGSNGLLARTSLGTTAARQLIAASSNISIVNPTGVSGNPSLDINDTLTLSQLILQRIPSNASYADSVLVLDRATGLLEVRPFTATVDTSVIATLHDLSLVNNGLSRNNDTTQFGQSISASGNPAALHSSREIPLNGYNTVFTGTGSIGIGTSSPTSSYKMTVAPSGSTGGIYVASGTSGIAVNASSSINAIVGQSTGGTGIGVSGSTLNGGGYGVQGSGGIGGIGGRFYTIAAGGDASPVALELERQPTGIGVSNGAGFTIMFRNAFTNGTTGNESGRLTNYFSNATSGSQTSAFGFHLMNNAVSARKALLSGNGQWTWDGYGSSTLQTIDTSFNTLVVDGSGNIWKRPGDGSGGISGSGTVNQVTYWTGSTSIGSNPSFVVDPTNKMFTINKAASDSPAISIKQNFTGIKKWLNVQSPVQNDSTLDFGFYSQIAPNDDGTTSNHVLVIGDNYDFKNALYGKSGDHWESHWRTGGVHYKERHYIVGLPNFEECRAFSSTFVVRDSLGNSQNTWDFRANTWSLKDLKSNDYFAISKGDNVAGSFSLMNLIGANPIMRLTDYGTGNTHSLQFTGTALTSSGPIVGMGNGFFGAAFTAQQTGGTSGGSQISLQKANGSNYDIRMNGTAAGGGFANDFYIYDDENNQMPMRVKANGHFQVNANGQSDQGQQFQVFGSALVTDSLLIRNVKAPPSTYNLMVHGLTDSVLYQIDSLDYAKIKNTPGTNPGVYFSPAQSFDGSFVVFASCIPYATNSFSHGTNITYGILDHTTSHNSSFYDSVYGNTGNGRIVVRYPAVKNVLNSKILCDETLSGYGLHLGPTVGNSTFEAPAYQTRSVGIRLTGDGSGNWTKTSDYALGTAWDVTTFSTSDGGTSFNVSTSVMNVGYNELSITYSGPNNYGIKRVYSGLGAYNARFIIVDRATGLALTTNPTTSDEIIISNAGMAERQVDLATYLAGNNEMIALSNANFWVDGTFECWEVAAPITTTSIQVRWQNYPSATQYKIYRATSLYGSRTLIHTGTDNSYIDTGLSSGTLYYYFMVATISGVDTDITYFRTSTKN